MKTADISKSRPERAFLPVLGALAAAIGLLALSGWFLGLPLLAGFGATRIPMAPSTAVLFLLCGTGIALRARTPLSDRAVRISRAAGWMVALVALLLFTLGFLNIHWPGEHLGLHITGTVGTVPIGYMSPVTALSFLLASLSFLATLKPLSSAVSARAVAATGTAAALLGLCCIFLLAYFFGSPLLYGGDYIPPALNTILAFIALGLALMMLAMGAGGLFGRSPADGSRTAFQFFLIFLLLTAGVVSAGYVYYRHNEEKYRAEVERQLSAVADLKASELTQYLTERMADGSILLRNPTISALVRRFLRKPEDADARRLLQIWLGKYQVHYHYSEVLLLDAQAVTRLSVPAGEVAISPPVVTGVSNALRSGQVTFLDFNRDEQDRHIHLGVLVPILDEQDADRPLGVIYLRIDPSGYLYPFINRWPSPSPSAETLLLRRDGDAALYLNDLRHRSNAALALSVPLERAGVPAVGAALGETGIMQGPDYRGVPVIAVVRAVPDSPWFLMAKIDTAEGYASLHAQLWQAVFIFGALLLAAGAGVRLIWRHQRIRLYRERAEALEALRESEEKYHSLFRNTSLGIFYSTFEGRFIDVNPALARMMGYASPAEAVRLVTNIAEQVYADPPKRDAVAAAALRAGGTISVENKYRRRDGTLWSGTLRLRVVPDQQGRPSHYEGIIEDITERLRDAEEKARLEDQLRQAQKVEAIGRLAGGVAHDFNNITAIILGYAEMLLGRLGPEDITRKYVEQIVASGQRAATLTRQLLAFGRRQTLQPEVLDLNSLLQNLHTMLGRLIGADIRLEFKLAAAHGRVTADKGQLEQVVINLVINARDAMPTGGTLTVETADLELDQLFTQCHESVVPGKYVLLAIADTGCGMDTATLARLFEPFYTTKERGKGTGLGLATAYGTVKQSGGYIWATSEPGVGTTFKIYLPRTDAHPREKVAESAGETPRGSGELILLVEDEAPLRELISTVLAAIGYRVRAAASGAEALSLALEQGIEPDLVLTDVIMPGMSGAALADRLRSDSPELKVLYMSGYPDDAIAPHGVLAAGTHFIQKPFTERAIATKLRDVLARKPEPAGRRVLMIDDDEQFRDLVRHFCVTRGHLFAGVDSAAAALAALAGQPFDVLLVDLNIPGTSGEQVLREIRAAGHATPAIVLTGDVASVDMNVLRPLGAVLTLEKSSNREPLLQAIAAAEAPDDGPPERGPVRPRL